MIASSLLLITGLIIVFVRHETRGQGPPPSLPTLLHQAIECNGPAIVDLGLLLLIATPVIRVAVLAVGWSIAREGRFALVALVVLALLGVSLTLGFG